MKNTKNTYIGIVVITLFVVGGFYFYSKNRLPESHITFPKGGETLVTGETYTIKWDNVGETGAPIGSTTQIYLVDEELLNQGAGISIIDRIYEAPDTGSYEYTVPSAASDSTYFFVVGTTTSNTFKITSKES